MTLKAIGLEFLGRMTEEMRHQIGAHITGELNPTTRTAIQNAVQQGIADGMSVTELADRIRSDTAFSAYRSELIARTEMMRVYNVAALRTYGDLGATEVQAIDGDLDEECAARDGRTFSILDADSIQDHPNGTLDWVPIVPQTGGTLGPMPPSSPLNPFGPRISVPVRPTPPVKVIAAPKTPVGFDEHLSALGEGRVVGTPAGDAQEAYWRHAELDNVQVERIANVTRDFAKYQDFSAMRYQIQAFLDADQVAAWTASTEFRQQVIEALERYRLQTGDRVFGSKFLRKMQFGEQVGNGLGYSRMGRDTLADADISGLIRLPPKRLLPYTGGDSARALRVAPKGRGVDEIVTHELGHALHNTWRYGGMEGFGEQTLWSTARRGSAPFRANLDQVKSYLASQIGERDAWAKLVKDWDVIPEKTTILGEGNTWAHSYTQKVVEWVDAEGKTHIVGTSVKFQAEQSLAIRNREITKITKQLAKAHMVPTEYAGKSIWEDFAESSMMYLLDPERLLRVSEKRYRYMSKWFTNV